MKKRAVELDSVEGKIQATAPREEHYRFLLGILERQVLQMTHKTTVIFREVRDDYQYNFKPNRNCVLLKIVALIEIKCGAGQPIVLNPIRPFLPSLRLQV